MSENYLYFGDNLDILRRHIKDETADLVYLDPPFNPNATYNVLFAEQNGSQAAQIKAFKDTWRWDKIAALSYRESTEAGGPVSKAMQAFRTFLGENNLLAYLSMMAPRLVELRRVLKPTGSIYLHCDPKASHYLKMLMDAVFGAGNFRREIIWTMSAPSGYKSLVNNFVRGHDVILYYARSEKVIFNKTFNPYSKKQLARFTSVDENGRQYRTITKTRRMYLDTAKGVPLTDVWSDIANFPMVVNAKERLGYATQKPEALLERIIQAGSNEGDTILDPFCGSGTTISVAQSLKRHWIGIDITNLAITLMKNRILDTFGEEIVKTYQVIGEPTSIPDAEALAKDDPYQFQYWALGLVGARPVPIDQKKGADKGIDGRLLFHGGKSAETKQVILSVKGGHTSSPHLRDLRGVVEREKAEIGVLITMQDPTPQMRSEAATGGFYESPWGTHPKLQILTVAELLAGKRIDMPPLRQVNITFKRAPKDRGRQPQKQSFLDETGDE